MFENVWNHTIEEILVEFSLRGAVVVFSEHGEESLMKLPMHSYDLSGRCVDGRIIGGIMIFSYSFEIYRVEKYILAAMFLSLHS